MEPELVSVKLDNLSETATIVEVKYRVPSGLEGVELMGVDAGLSWIKNESLQLEKTETSNDYTFFTGYLAVESSCEFRARGYDDSSDHWEAGLGNHRIEIQEDRTIDFSTHLDAKEFQFRGDLPTIFNPDISEVRNRIENLEEQAPSLFQVLVDLSFWIDLVVEDPLNDENINLIPTILNYLIPRIRNRNSYKVDSVARPVVVALFKMYKSMVEFYGDSEDILVDNWKKEGWLPSFVDIPKQIEELEDARLGIGKDAEKRFLDLLKYV